VAEVDAAGNVTKSYGYKPGSTWTTDPLFMKVGGQYYFYQNDHLGTPQKLTAVNGAVVWSAKYSSFGLANVDPSSTISNNLRFPGQYFDQETDLHYNWHRYYDSKTGRYLKPDPIGFDGGINFYVYVQNNSVKFIDPSGLQLDKVGTECSSLQRLKVDKICNKECASTEYCRQVKYGDMTLVLFNCTPWKEEQPIPDPEEPYIPPTCFEWCKKNKKGIGLWWCYLGCFVGGTSDDNPYN